MFIQYFGRYLLDKGLITNEQYKNALAIEKDSCAKIGILAVNSGLLTAQQVDEIHNMQTKVDMKFGELAIDKGYLTEEQLSKILEQQRTAHLLFGQALIDNEYLTLAKLENELNNFRMELGLSENEFNAIKEDDIDEIVKVFINLEGITNSKLYKEYIALFIRNIVRFICNDIRIEKFEVTKNYKTEYMVVQHIVGQPVLITSINACKEPFLEFASIFAGEELVEVDEFALESAGEFLNLHNGIFTVNESNNGKEYDLTPQAYFESEYIEQTNDVIGVKIYLPFGEMNLILGAE